MEKEEKLAEPTRKQLIALMQLRFAPENRLSIDRWLAYIAGVCGGLIEKDGLQRILQGDHPKIQIDMESVGLVPDMRRFQFFWNPVVSVEPSGKYANQEILCSATYPENWRMLPVARQAELLKQFFDELDVSQVQKVAQGIMVPEGFDGLAVIPKFAAIADLAHDYTFPPFNVAMKRLMRVFSQEFEGFKRDAFAWSPGTAGLYEPTRAFLEELAESTPGDCLVMPVQTGILHRGRSVQRARVCYTDDEYGLDMFSVGCILLTHQGRLAADALHIICPGSSVQNSLQSRVDWSCNGVWQKSSLVELVRRSNYKPVKNSGCATAHYPFKTGETQSSTVDESAKLLEF